MYIDAFYDRKNNKIQVVERLRNGERNYVDYEPEHSFYYLDAKGKYTSIYGEKLSKFETTNIKTFQNELKLFENRKLYESDINVINKCLETNYYGLEPPTLNIGYFDIEVDYDQQRGYSSVDDPFNPVTSIALYLSKDQRLISVSIAPKTLSSTQAQKLIDDFPDAYVVDDEHALLKTFVDLIEDCDILTGWNSGLYDIPYLMNRITKVLGREYTKKFCLWDQYPKKREFARFKKKYTTFDLVGRIHLDYLDLYKKNEPGERHSFALNAIGEYENVGEKTQYSGTLDNLYNTDFRKFVEYNRQDVMIIVKLEAKKKFINLANVLSHQNTVLIPVVMGSVALIEQAIINHAHQMKLIVPDRKTKSSEEDTEEDEVDEDDETEGAAGAFVADPIRGLHDWVACVDINSLYPSTIRTFNMSPETLFGQIEMTETEQYILDQQKDIVNERGRTVKGMSASEAWGTLTTILEMNDVINKTDKILKFKLEESGEILSVSGRDLNEFVYGSEDLCITANGTVFKTDKKGIIADILTQWYEDRLKLQASKSFWSKYAKDGLGLKKSGTESQTCDFADLEQIIQNKDQPKINYLIEEIEKNQKKYKEKSKELIDYYDLQQYLKKILLNSLYGALLNEYMRFYDKRIGQSTTLTGRNITQHMGSEISRLICGKYDYKTDVVKYGDSVTSDTVIRTTLGDMTIEELYEIGDHFHQENEKKYSYFNNKEQTPKVVGYNSYEDTPNWSEISYAMKHSVNKKIYKIILEDGSFVKITEDHALIVDRDGFIMDITPVELKENDLIIKLKLEDTD